MNKKQRNTQCPQSQGSKVDTSRLSFSVFEGEKNHEDSETRLPLGKSHSTALICHKKGIQAAVWVLSILGALQ
jgi:hypothetical protein